MNAPLPPAYPPSTPPYYGPHTQRGAGRRHWTSLLGATAATVGIIAAGAGGVIVGTRMTRAESASSPSIETVRAQTIDLCTRFAAAYAAMPTPQKSGLDLIPTASYLADALRDNPLAGSAIRDSIRDSLEQLRDHAARLSGEPVRGAIQPPTTWSVDVANLADQQAWDACRAFDR